LKIKALADVPFGKRGADHKQDCGTKHTWSLQVLEGVNVTIF
jgi:hypothetical protein